MWSNFGHCEGAGGADPLAWVVVGYEIVGALLVAESSTL